MTANHDDLNLHDPEDRAIYRQRVAVEFAMMKIEMVRKEAGMPASCPRHYAIAAIADHRMQAMGVSLKPLMDP